MAAVVWAGTSQGRKTTQRVNTARWRLQEPVPGEERGGDPPTSQNDSLVAVRAGIEVGSGRGRFNEPY